MKTIKEMLKDLLRSSTLKENEMKKEVEMAGSANEDKPAIDASQSQTNLNFKNYETENHESAGDPCMAPADAQKSGVETEREKNERGQEEGAGRGEAGGDSGTPGRGVIENETEIREKGEMATKSERNYEKEIADAYQKGLIDGRNQKIEETYFPKNDDGVPHFHGCSNPYSPVSDIFNIARGV